MSELNRGTVVQLKSGGPLMTSTAFPNCNGYVSCAWFVDGDVKIGTFPVDAPIVSNIDKEKK